VGGSLGIVEEIGIICQIESSQHLVFLVAGRNLVAGGSSCEYVSHVVILQWFFTRAPSTILILVGSSRHARVSFSIFLVFDNNLSDTY